MGTEVEALPACALRDDAEAKLACAPPVAALARSPAGLLHELQVHQIELEMQNVTLRQAQVALEESRDRYVELFEFAPVGYLMLSRAGQICAINLTGAALLNEDRGKLIGRRFAHFVVPGEQDAWQRHFRQAFRQGEKQTHELSLQRSDGTVFAASLDCLCAVSNAAAPALRVTLTDITERRRLIAQASATNERLERVTALQAGYLRELATELTYAEQRERDRLYERLHSEAQPLLVAARLSLASLNARTPPQDYPPIAAKACEQISRVIRMARGLSLQLSTPLIRERGLAPALESLCHWVKDNHGLEVDLISAPEAEPEEMVIRLLCFNAVREFLMNVVKHAGTSRVTLTLQRADPDTLRLTVADRGCGFAASAVKNGSGLAWIERRLGMLGGCLQIDSQPGHGCVAMLSVPLRAVAG